MVPVNLLLFVKIFLAVLSILVIVRAIYNIVAVVRENKGKVEFSIKEQWTIGFAIAYLISVLFL